MANNAKSTWDVRLNGRDGSFEAQIDRIVANTEKRLELVMKQSLINTINDMQTVGPSVASTKAAIKTGLGGSGKGKNYKPVQGPVTAQGKGGRMRVDTGFLRASGQVSFNGMPTGPSRKPEDANSGSFNWQGAMMEAEIQTATVGATIYWGWTASYAKYREAYDGFMYASLQNWQKTVDAVIAEAKKRFG